VTSFLRNVASAGGQRAKQPASTPGESLSLRARSSSFIKQLATWRRLCGSNHSCSYPAAPLAFVVCIAKAWGPGIELLDHVPGALQIKFTNFHSGGVSALAIFFPNWFQPANQPRAIGVLWAFSSRFARRQRPLWQGHPRETTLPCPGAVFCESRVRELVSTSILREVCADQRPNVEISCTTEGGPALSLTSFPNFFPFWRNFFSSSDARNKYPFSSRFAEMDGGPPDLAHGYHFKPSH